MIQTGAVKQVGGLEVRSDNEWYIFIRLRDGAEVARVKLANMPFEAINEMLPMLVKWFG